MVRIDQELCIGCGACAKDCVAKNLSLADGEVSVRRGCLQCGHCVAVCPTKAVSIPDFDMDDVEDCTPADCGLDPERLLRAIKFRRSVRSYQPRRIETEKLQAIVQAGRYTATAKNTQGCRFILVQEELEAFKEIIWSGLGRALALPEEDAPRGVEHFRGFCASHAKDPANDFLFRNAPAVLFIAAAEPIDAGLAAQNMELQATALGLGALYNGYLTHAATMLPEARNWLGAGEKTLAACMLLGYPDAGYLRTAPRRKADVVWR